MKYYTRMIAILLLSMAVSITLTWIFGFFVGLAMTFAVFILLFIYLRQRAMRGAAGIFSGGVNYVCIACGHRFKGGTCPRCGSKIRRAEF